MNQISFELLFKEDNESARKAFVIWSDSVAKGIDEDYKLLIDDAKLDEFLSNIRNYDVPANGGYEKASPFKKAAYLYVSLISCNPFVKEEERFDRVYSPDHVSAATVGYGLVKSCLKGATSHRSDGSTVVLENAICVSVHYFKDFIEASRGLTLVDSFKTYSILFEALAYQGNKDASYPPLI